MTPFDLSSLNPDEWLVIAACVAAFLAAGTVKGMVGVGLPMIAIPLIASVTSPVQAIALASVPVVVSNGWQAFHGGHVGPSVRRFWPLLISLVGGTLIGVQILVTIDPRIVSGILGTVLVIFTTIQALPRRPELAPGTERWLGPAFGLVGGVLGGVSGLFGPSLVLFLVALRLPKDVFVSAIALFFFVGSLPLFIGLVAHGILSPPQLALSTASAVPVVAGLLFGRYLRQRVSQARFEKILFVVLILIGLNLIRRAFL